jgi:3-isopropylmalate/(R)-2-methylmalate dehydratase small subunit
VIEGRAHKYGDHIDTDVIIPGRYATTVDPAELGPHYLEGLDPNFVQKVRPGDLLVGGENFGCGSSREHAPLAITGAGIACVIVRSFARIFYRNAINLGLPILISPGAADAIPDGAIVRVNLNGGLITCGDETFLAEPFPPFLQRLIAAGGLVPYVRDRLAGERRPAPQ